MYIRITVTIRMILILLSNISQNLLPSAQDLSINVARSSVTAKFCSLVFISLILLKDLSG